MWLQYLSESLAVDVPSGTTLDQCPVLHLLLAFRDLLVVLASKKVKPSHDGGCRREQPTGGLTAQVRWLGPRVDGRLVMFCIHRMNSRNDFVVLMTAL